MSDRDTIKVGDVVQLRSGGSAMTVAEISNRVLCVWFEYSRGDMFSMGGGGQSLRREAFDPAMLRKVTP